MGKSFLKSIKNADITESGFYYTLSLISGKYKIAVLYTLYIFEIARFNEIQKYIKVISHKTLTATLKELESDSLIERTVYPEIPPKVEYKLSERGKSLIPLLEDMCNWGEENRVKK